MDTIPPSEYGGCARPTTFDGTAEIRSFAAARIARRGLLKYAVIAPILVATRPAIAAPHRRCGQILHATDRAECRIKRNGQTYPGLRDSPLYANDLVSLANPADEAVTLILFGKLQQSVDANQPQYRVPGSPPFALVIRNLDRIFENVSDFLFSFRKPRRSEQTIAEIVPTSGDRRVTAFVPVEQDGAYMIGETFHWKVIAARGQSDVHLSPIYRMTPNSSLRFASLLDLPRAKFWPGEVGSDPRLGPEIGRHMTEGGQKAMAAALSAFPMTMVDPRGEKPRNMRVLVVQEKTLPNPPWGRAPVPNAQPWADLVYGYWLLNHTDESWHAEGAAWIQRASGYLQIAREMAQRGLMFDALDMPQRTAKF